MKKQEFAWQREYPYCPGTHRRRSSHDSLAKRRLEEAAPDGQSAPDRCSRHRCNSSSR
jgi:hypothetical protein